MDVKVGDKIVYFDGFDDVESIVSHIQIEDGKEWLFVDDSDVKISVDVVAQVEPSQE